MSPNLDDYLLAAQSPEAKLFKYPGFIVGGRGFGKNARQAEWLRSRKALANTAYGWWQKRNPVVPPIDSVRWACPKPTDPVPGYKIPGSALWYAALAQDIHAGKITFAQAVAEAERVRG